MDTPSLGFAERLAVELLKILSASVDIRRLAMKLAAGKVAECPFSEELVNEGRELLFLALEMAGTELPVRERPEGQPFFLAAIEELLRISGDPDSAAFYTSADSFAKGVKLGVDVALPRVPAVFEEKVRHRKYGEDAEWQRVERANYVSAAERASEVQAQFEEEEKLGAMIQMSAREASKRYGDKLRFASLGAIEKKDGTKRVTHDATHGVGVNSAIQLKDQVRYPTAGDLRTALMTLPRAFFGLTGDVKRAHRLVKLATSDWGYTACRTGVQGEDMLWLNSVGTFGVSSVAFHWCRLMGGLGRAAYYLIACLEILHMVYSDDLFWLTQDSANGIDYIVLQVFFYVVVGVPFSWKKFCGGIEFAWVGFCVSIKDRALGISERQATWLVDWLKKTVRARHVRIADLRAVMGRLSFALTALGHLRPFLGPLYAWLAVAQVQHIGHLPKAVVYIMTFLAAALEGHGRLLPVGRLPAAERELFRTDARAEGNEIWIGGWALDHQDKRKCRWFAEKLDHGSAPWLYARCPRAASDAGGGGAVRSAEARGREVVYDARLELTTSAIVTSLRGC